jgi:hypothetical protein
MDGATREPVVAIGAAYVVGAAKDVPYVGAA